MGFLPLLSLFSLYTVVPRFLPHTHRTHTPINSHVSFCIRFSTSSFISPALLHYLLFLTRFSLADFFTFLDGFFDAGMLQQALKANRGDAEPSVERDVIRRNIGRRLRLAEY
jgi:hypothetical protein